MDIGQCLSSRRVVLVSYLSVVPMGLDGASAGRHLTTLDSILADLEELA
jgi:hypothetical protein